MATAFRSAQVLLRRQVLATAPKSMRLQPVQFQARGMTKASRVLRAAEEESASRKHQAQTTGTRLARLKNIPPELVPLAAVLLLGVGMAIFSMARSLFTDPTLRLMPSKKVSNH